MRLSAAQERYHLNATVIAASRLIFDTLSNDVTLVHRLGDIAATTSGGTPDRQIVSYFGGDIPWIKSGELNDDMIQQAAEFITEEGLHHSSAKVFPKGSLLVALYGATVGKTGILGLDAATNQAVCMISPRSNNVVTRYLYWFLRYKRPDFLNDSFGGAQPNISQKHLQDTPTPLPPPDIQRAICAFLDGVEMRRVSRDSTDLVELPYPLHDVKRIVVRVEALAARIEQARGLRREAMAEADTVMRQASNQVFASIEASEVQLVDLLREDTLNGIGTRPSDVPPGIPILRISAGTSRSDGIVDEGDYKYIEADEHMAEKYRLKPGDLLACRFNGNLSYVGRFSIYAGSSGLIHLFPDKLIRFRVDTSKAEPQYVLLAMNSPMGRERVEGYCATTAGNIGISAGNLKSISIPVPTLAVQRRIVAFLDDLQAQVDALKRLQAESAAELDALLPSVLDRAFRGEL